MQRAQPYKNWPERDKGALQTAFDAAWNSRSIEVDDLPASILRPGDDSGPATALSPADAYALYLASVGQSLAVEIDAAWTWRFNIFPHHCCVIIATTRRQVNRTRTVQWRCKCRHTTRSRNSSGSIIFGQEWMPRLRAWAAAIISTFPLSDRIGRGSIAYVGAGHVSYSSHLRELFFD